VPRQIEQVRWFVDESLYPVGAALAEVRTDTVHPGHLELPQVPRGTLDLDWIPIVAQSDHVVITRDRFAHQGEWLALRDAGVRVVRMAGKAETTSFERLKLLCDRWAAMERMTGDAGDGPWLITMDSAGALAKRGGLVRQAPDA